MRTLQRRFALIRRCALGILMVVPLLVAQGAQPASASVVQFNYSGTDGDVSAFGSFTIDDTLFDGTAFQSIANSNLLSFSFSMTNTTIPLTGTWDTGDLLLANAIIFDSMGVPPDVVIGSGFTAGGTSGSIAFLGMGGVFHGQIGTISSGNWQLDTVVSAVPLPAALPLFLSALAGLGLMGWRRRQAAG